MKFFSEYQGLRREIYIIFYGRIVSSMGALIWPMLTLILRNKIGLSAQEIASLMLLMGVFSVPCIYLGGYLADHFSKKWIIIICDLVTVIAFMVCGFIEIDMIFIYVFFVAGLFQSIESPSYDAIVADFSTSEQRTRAYSLNYLGNNIGLILSPIIGGILFENYLNLAFIINGGVILLSTFLIFKFIPTNTLNSEESNNAKHEVIEKGTNTIKVLLKRPVILLYILSAGFSSLIYSQFNYLIPLNLESLYGSSGAKIFGTIVSVNGLIVIVFTPIFTKMLRQARDISKIFLGQMLIVLGLALYIFIQGMFVGYYISIIIFTFGEIMNTLGSQPFVTRRIPANYRGRITSYIWMFAMIFQAVSQLGVGYFFDHYSLIQTWMLVTAVGLIVVIGLGFLRKLDIKAYPDL